MGSDAARCRANGWGPGTRLELAGVSRVVVTAVGEQRVMGRYLEFAEGGEGRTGPGEECTLVLGGGEWREIEG